MYFKSLSDLSKDIHEWIPDLPENIELIVGIPRSGMLVASIVSLKLNLPLAELDGFLQGHVLGKGRRMHELDNKTFLNKQRKVLILDDSVSSGKAMTETKESLFKANLGHEIVYGAVYVTQKGKTFVDIYFEILQNPRRFEWNILSSPDIKNFCFDMDGVLCNDPLPYENDDGDKYKEFIGKAKPLYIPNNIIGNIVTSRLEKYRSETEDWLRANNIKYKKLNMLNIANKELRIKNNSSIDFKSEFYKKL